MKTYFLLILLCVSHSFLSAQVPRDTIKVGYTNAPPFIITQDENLEGISVRLWENVANKLDLEYEMIPLEFTDMLDKLENGEIDISINPLTITSDRNKLMQFTTPFFASNSTIVVAESSALEKLIQFVKNFFNANFLKGFLVLLFIIFVFGFLGWYFERHKNPTDFRRGTKGIWDGLWWSAVTLTTVGYGDKAPKSKMGKIAALALMFVGLLFISGLTAGIASSLTVDKISSQSNSLDEFKERKVGTVNNSSTSGFLKNNFFRDIHHYQIVEDGLTALNNEEIAAFIYDEPILKYRLKQNESYSDLKLVNLKFDVQFYAFALHQNNSDLEERITQKILEITSSHDWKVTLNEFELSGY